MRIEIEDGLYDVTSRGWERRVIVKDDRDRQEWLKLLDRVAPPSGITRRGKKSTRSQNPGKKEVWETSVD